MKIKNIVNNYFLVSGEKQKIIKAESTYPDDKRLRNKLFNVTLENGRIIYAFAPSLKIQIKKTLDTVKTDELHTYILNEVSKFDFYERDMFKKIEENVSNLLSTTHWASTILAYAMITSGMNVKKMKSKLKTLKLRFYYGEKNENVEMELLKNVPDEFFLDEEIIVRVRL